MPPSNRKRAGKTKMQNLPSVKAKAARLAAQAAADDDAADAVPAVDDGLLAADAADGARRVRRQPAAERERGVAASVQPPRMRGRVPVYRPRV